MSKKVALAAVMCLVFGSSSMITGPVANNMIDYVIEDSVDEVLLIAQEIAIPIVEDVINMTNFVETVGLIYDPTPFGALVIGTGSPLELLFNLFSVLDRELVLTAFFDVLNTGNPLFPSFYDGVLSYSTLATTPYYILGVSQWAGEALLFGDARNKLIVGTNELPGICSVVYDEMGAYSPEGWWALLALYDEARGTPEKEQALADGYGTTWYKLDKLVRYYREYYMIEVIPQNLNHPLLSLFFPGAAGMNSTEMAEYFFLNQWATCIIFPDGIDISQFNLIPGFPPGLKGLEAKFTTRSDFPLSTLKALWDVNNPHSLVNNEGNKMWWSAVSNEETRLLLTNEFGLTHDEMKALLEWRGVLTGSIIPIAGGSLLGWGTDLTTWRNSLQLGLMLFGGSFALLGSSVIYGNLRVKRSRNANLKPLSPKKPVAHQLIKNLQDDMNDNI